MSDPRSDEELLAVYVDPRSSLAQREASFRLLVERYQGRVYGICLRHFGNRADAQDAAQDAFLSLARKADQFRGGSKLSTWIYRIAVNACHDLGRKYARRPQTPVQDPALVADGSAATTDDALAGRELATEIERALLELDELSRSLIILCSIEGHSYAEVSAMLDLPVGTIKSRVFRARARLADLLQPVLEDSEMPSTTRGAERDSTASPPPTRPRAPPHDPQP